ncbi:MAG TPA: hypothetical protein VMF30_08190 [Pirellulales bacterium]|nr:hypothetical protein [Pirellulales bacterium]
MPAVFDKLGVRFLYPENWTLDEQEALAGDNAVTVYSPEGGFWSLMLHPRSVDPDELTLAALDAMKAEFTDFEAEPASETIEGFELSGYDMNFYCLDLTNTALVRGFRTADATCIILYQAEDRDFATTEPVFRAITYSLLREAANGAGE